MNAALIVRPSSLGDIVYAMAIVADIRRERPELVIDWVAEPGFAPLIHLCPNVRQVISFGLRRWRREFASRRTWRELRTFGRELRQTRYEVVLDLQEQLKGALVSRIARGVRHGFDRASIREPLATLGDDVHHRVSREIHFVARCRQLAGAALGYAPEGLPRWNLQPPASAPGMPERPYVMILHATSRAGKLWPEAQWRMLIEHFDQAGYATVLPWGNPDEAACSSRLAEGVASAIVPPWLTLPDAAALLSHATLAVGVDTGFTHLAAALRTPTLAIFGATDPVRHGVACAGAHAVDIGDTDAAPTHDEVLAAAGAMLRRATAC